jgi:hypothetical protein
MNEPHRAQLSITLTHAGALVVTGPINDLVLCYGLLEGAKDQVRRHVEVQAKERDHVAKLVSIWPANGLLSKQ